jgi:hypothetical protein
MESNNIYEGCAIICAGIGGWYPKGVQRLNDSLDLVGYTGARFMFTDYQPGWVKHEQTPYGFKIDAIEAAINAGFKYVLWLDASMYAVNSLAPIFDKIKQDGYYFVKNGFNCAQECNDASLIMWDIDRDEAEEIPIIATGVIGLNFNGNGGRIVKFWKIWRDEGMFSGSRNHDGQSNDPRFLHHRQDQSALSLVLEDFISSEQAHELGNEVAYANQTTNESNHILICKGM